MFSGDGQGGGGAITDGLGDAFRDEPCESRRGVPNGRTRDCLRAKAADSENDILRSSRAGTAGGGRLKRSLTLERPASCFGGGHLSTVSTVPTVPTVSTLATTSSGVDDGWLELCSGWRSEVARLRTVLPLELRSVVRPVLLVASCSEM